MDAARRQQLIKRRAVAKASLTRMQNFLESGDLKVNEFKVRFDELPGIFNKCDTAQDELELHDDADHSDPSNRWKTFVGNRVATIQEESASATWRHVPSQSNPADLIPKRVEPATQQHPHYGGRDHNGLHRSHSAGLQRRSILLQKFWN